MVEERYPIFCSGFYMHEHGCMNLHSHIHATHTRVSSPHERKEKQKKGRKKRKRKYEEINEVGYGGSCPKSQHWGI